MVAARLELRLILDADGSRNVFAVENWGEKQKLLPVALTQRAVKRLSAGIIHLLIRTYS